MKELQKSMSITDASEITVTAVVEKLKLNYKEYQFENKDKLIETVRGVLTVLTEVKEKAPIITGSLNQMMTNNYNKSKRSRPEEPEGATSTEEKTKEAKTEAEIKLDEVDGSIPVKTSAEKGSSSSKKKKAATRSYDAIDNINPLLVHTNALLFISLT